jgi:glycosyltransferase involved in cell wall biosynthesis
MTNMRILILITKSNWGGAQKYVYDLATSLPKDKYQVKVAAGGAGATGGESGPLVERLKEAGIEVIPIYSLSNETGLRKEATTIGQLWKIIRKEKPDVLHVNSSKAGLFGAVLGRIMRVKKIIFTAHGWAFNEERPWYQRAAIKFLHWLTIILCHTTITVSQNLKDAFKNWPLVGGKIIVIRNGIAGKTGYGRDGARQALATMFPQLKAAIAHAVSAHKRIFWVGTLAELHPIKNIDKAIEAIAELASEKRVHHAGRIPYFIYTVMGEGRERARLAGMIASLGLSDRVFLLGHVPDAFQYIKAFDTFLLPSRSEGLGYVILEAGMQTVPVIATAVGGIPEIVEDMKSGILIQPNKPTEIASAIEFYSEHADTAREYARALNERVRELFSLEMMVKETEEVYGI